LVDVAELRIDEPLVREAVAVLGLAAY